MAIKPELKEWMDKLPLSDNVRTILAGEMEKDEVQKAMEQSMVPRSTFSKELDKKDQEVAAQRQQIEADKKAAAAAKQSYETYLASEQKRVNEFYDKNNKALIAEQNQRKAYETQLGKLVADGLITPEEATVAKTEFVPTQPVNPTPSPRYASKEELAQSLEQTQFQNVHAIARINDIADAHFDLFGTRLNRQELVQATLDAGGKKKVEEVWAEKYGVEARRAELQKAADEARIKAAVDEAVVRDRSERMIEGGNAPYSGLDDGQDKHLLSLFSSKDGVSRGLGVTPGVAKAVEAYRQKQAAGSVKTG
jgi:hypothetical protein